MRLSLMFASGNIVQISSHTPKPLPRPASLNMMTEEHDEHVDELTKIKLQLTTTPQSIDNVLINSTTKEEPKGRSLNFTIQEHNHENELSKSKKIFEDLSDVSMDEDENDDVTTVTRPAIPKEPLSKSGTFCNLNGLTYEHGEKLESGCDSICTCLNGAMNCTERCLKPFIKKGVETNNTLCIEEETEDPCCSTLTCDAKTKESMPERCSYKNKNYKTNERIEDGCESICFCESSGNITCEPRCKTTNKLSDKCVEVPDPDDSCCKKVLCDVTLNDHDSERDQEETQKIKLVTAKMINSTTVKLDFDPPLKKNYSVPEIEGSVNANTWKTLKLSAEGYLKNQDSNVHYLRIKGSQEIIEISDTVQDVKKPIFKCEYKGHQLKLGEEYNDNCTSLCICRQNGIQCLKMECPTYFGVDVLNPSCLEWESEPPDFVPSPPNCCPKSVTCKNNGSCEYKREMYTNWQQIPTNITGCEKRCYCEMGNVECQNICPPVTALPPANLECPPQLATLNHLPDDDCCMYWVCGNGNLLTGPKHNLSAELEENENTSNKTITDSINLVSQKIPSKIVGPLIIYKNKIQDPELNILSDKIIKNHSKDYSNANRGVIYEEVMETTKNKVEQTTIAHFVPTEIPPISITSKSPNRFKPNKTSYTPIVLPNYINVPFLETPQKELTSTAHEHNHDKDYAEKLLQFINDHPDLINYPSGSILEVHNVYNDYQKNPLHSQQNNLISTNHNPQIPYITPNQHQLAGFDIISPLSPNDILQQIHQPPPFFTSNNPILPQQNFTQPGMKVPYPGGFPNVPPGFQQPQEEINIYLLEAVDPQSIRIGFSVPSIIVGLHGQFDIRYTDNEENNNPNTWLSQVFTPANDLIETPQLEVTLQGLKEDTPYKIKIIVTLRDLHNVHSSRVYTVRTLKNELLTTLPPQIPIEPNLVVADVNATRVTIEWRRFSDKELQYIDGIQLRYKEIDGKIYAATPLIHRAVTTYTLENLKPNAKYEAGIFFVPFPEQLTELHSGNMLHFTTANEVDNYSFNVTLEIGTIKSTSIEITWSGVPYPEDKYVNIYRAISQSDSGKGDFSTFKVAKRDAPPKATIMDLKPGIRYRLWLEIYLTNGRIKTSNVQDFITKPKSVPSLSASTQQDKLEAGDLSEHRGDYYGPLVIVAILAAIAIISTLILLLILVKRHSQNKAAITSPPRISQSAYDNPTYKVEIQQETMNL
ncbi:hypothetical protein FQA39_LY07625 [Lamprigera yunnana]|nr:hypothetical protein FQA39_LY07625 [Lamprigera yunnana]